MTRFYYSKEHISIKHTSTNERKDGNEPNVWINDNKYILSTYSPII